MYENCDTFVFNELLENLEESRTAGKIDENLLRVQIEEIVSIIQKQMNKEL